jgi:molybdopterin molybdotransferase
MTAMKWEQARECVLQRVSQDRRYPATESIDLRDCAGRVLAENVIADRDYPPFARSMRDGFALYAADVPGRVRLAGEVRAGEQFTGSVARGQAVEIMTGAPVPTGPDAVVMVEHVQRDGEWIVYERTAKAGDNISPRASEGIVGDTVLPPGIRIGFPEVAMLATVGRSCVLVHKRPRIAIVATGDEIIEVDQRPLEHQIRNSNAHSLAVQVARAGGEPHILPIARDNYESTRAAVRAGLEDELLVLSGGVSAGKYDIVEKVLAEFGAEFYFDRVLIQPGQPAVFGAADGRFFFGLPGNPASTMVTFELFARAAVELLGGQTEPLLPILMAKLTTPFKQKMGLARFLPARLKPTGMEVTPEAWKGSGDVGALARANAFLVTDPARESWNAGDLIQVLVR